MDAFYILLAGLGVSKLIEKKNVKAIFKIVGSLVLVIFGLNIILNVFNINLIPGLNLKPNTANISIQGLILTLSNPITIVDKDVFDKVQEMLKVQRRSTNKNDLISGYLFCEDCGAPMILIKGKNNAYYYCRSNRSKGICTKHTIRQTILYNNVIDLLNKKKLEGEPINELSRDIVIKYIEKVTVYDNEKIDVILKYEDEIIKN